MADVLTLPGAGTNGGVPAPYLQGTIFPAGPGLGGRIALGMGQQTRRFSDIISTEGGAAISEAQLQSLLTAVAQGAASQQVVNYNFEGMVGPPGPPGKTIVQYLPPVNGVGQTGRYGADGADAFANIDIPIPYTGTATKWEACFTNNSPGTGSVAWITFKVKYKGVESDIAAGNTANAWLYWNASASTVVSSSATKPTLTAGQWLLGYNNAGTFEPSFFCKLITAGFLSVNALSAIAADLGTVTAGTVVMNLGGNNRLKLSPSGLQGSTDAGANYYDIITVEVSGARITALSVDTPQLADGAASSDKSARTAGVTGTGTVQTVSSFVSAGGTTQVKGDVQVRGDTIFGDIAHISVKRDATTIYGPTDTVINASGGAWTTVDWDVWETPGAGTYDYTIYVTTDDFDASTQQRNLWCREGIK